MRISPADHLSGFSSWTYVLQWLYSYTTLLSVVSVVEAQKAMAEAERLANLTELAFLFIPLGFSTHRQHFSQDERMVRTPDPDIYIRLNFKSRYPIECDFQSSVDLQSTA